MLHPALLHAVSLHAALWPLRVHGGNPDDEVRVRVGQHLPHLACEHRIEHLTAGARWRLPGLSLARLREHVRELAIAQTCEGLARNELLDGLELAPDGRI